MKKLLSILSAIIVTSTGASSVVACSDGLYSNAVWNANSEKISDAYDSDIIKTSLVSRAKSLILDDQFGFNDATTKDYALNKQINNFSSIINQNDNDEVNYLRNKTVADEYSNFIDDSSIKDLTGINTKGEVGNEGGIFNFLENTVIGKIKDATIGKLPAEAQTIINSILGDMLNIKSGESDAQLAETIKPLLQAVGKVNVKTALAGIPYAFKLIPNLSDYNLLIKVVGMLSGTVLSPLQKSIDPAIDKLAKAADLTDLGDETLDKIPDEINSILVSLLTGKYDNAKCPDSFTATLRFMDLTGMYLSMIPHDTNDTFKELSDLSSIKLSDVEYYKIGQGKTLNIAPLLNEVSYYLSNANNSDRVQKLLQILFLKDTTTLNAVGTNIVTKYIAPLINSLIGGEANLDEIKSSFVKTLTDAVEFDNLYNDWENTGITLNVKVDDKQQEVKLADKIKENINAGGDLYHTFFYNNRAPYEKDSETGEVYNKASLKNLITLPIYKLLGLGKVPGYEFNNENLENTGLLPNVAGYYTQESMEQLSQEITNMFGFNTDDQDVTTTQNELKYHLFDFNKLKDFIDRLLFNKDSFLNTFISETQDPDLVKSPEKLANKLAIDLGYVSDNGVANPKFIYVKEKDGKQDTLIAEMIKMLLPAVDSDVNKDMTYTDNTISDDNDLKSDVINKSDNLKFMFSGLTSFVGNIMKGTDYTYWLSKVVNNFYDNGVIDPEGVAHAIFDYRDGYDPDKPWNNKDISTGFQTKYFKNGAVKSIKLVINFNLGDVPQLVNGVKVKGNNDISIKEHLYSFEISRDSITHKFKFINAERKW